jgi:hypothetical protein
MKINQPTITSILLGFTLLVSGISSANVSEILLGTVTAGSNQSICEGESHTISDADDDCTGNDYLWTTSGDGTFNDDEVLNPVYTPGTNDIAAGTVDLTLTWSDGDCGDSSDSMTLTIDSNPEADAGSNQTKCTNNPATTLSGNVTHATGGTWSGGAGGFSPNSNNLNAVYTPTAGEISSGSVTLTLTTTGNGSCPADTDVMTISFSPSPVVSAGANQSICANNATVSLSGSVANAGGGTWTGGAGTYVPNANTLTATYTPTASEISAGTLTLTLTSTGNGNCNAVSATTEITINPAPIVNAGNNQSVCANNPAIALNGQVTNASGGVWSGGAGTYTPGNSSLNAQYTPTAGEITSGNIALTLTSTGNGNCNAVTDVVNITITPSPTVSAGTNETLCSNDASIELNGEITVANGGTWTGGSGTFNPNSNTLNATYNPSAGEIASGNITLTLTTTGNGNCLVVADEVTFNFTPAPTISVGNTQSICQGETTLDLDGSIDGSATGVIWSSNSEGTFSNHTDLNATWTPPVNFTGNATLTLTTTGMEPCQAISAQVVIEVIPNVFATVNYPTNTFCETSESVSPVITGNNPGTFSTTAGLNINANTGIINPSLSNPGVYDVTYFIDGIAGCSDFEVDFEIVIAPVPDAQLDASNILTICENSSVEFIVNDDPFSDYTNYDWSVLDINQNSIGTIEEDNDQSIVYSIGEQTDETTITVVLTETIGTCSTTTQTPVNVQINPETCGFFELAGDVLAACSEVGSFYQWGCGTTAIAGENSNSFVHTAFSQLNSCDAFWVQVSLYENFSCPIYLGDASQITGIADETLSSQLLLYPNPASELITLKLGTQILTSGIIEIYSYDGKLCYSGVTIPGSLQQTLDISNLSSGSYVLSLMLNEGKAIQSFVVSK